MVLSVVATAALCVADGAVAPHSHDPEYLVVSRWVYDFRFLFEQLILVSSILYVAAIFLETRTVFSVGFNTGDTSRISTKGPDADKIVWIGRKYDSDIEAETVAAALREKLARTGTH